MIFEKIQDIKNKTRIPSIKRIQTLMKEPMNWKYKTDKAKYNLIDLSDKSKPLKDSINSNDKNGAINPESIGSSQKVQWNQAEPLKAKRSKFSTFLIKILYCIFS